MEKLRVGILSTGNIAATMATDERGPGVCRCVEKSGKGREICGKI